MKAILCLLCVAVCTVTALPVDETKREYPRFVDFPDEDGVLHQVDLEAEPDLELINEITRNPNNNKYRLFTRRNPTSAQELKIDDENSITSSNFNARNPTIVIAHGWLSNQKSNLNPVIRDAYFGIMDANVIIIEWRLLALMPYPTAVRGVPEVGRGLGRFLRFLNSVTGAQFGTMHLIGFSLGAHLVGNAGRELGGRVGRVTGLDPAGPLWASNENRLQPADGIYVEAIHTDGGLGLGLGRECANADFFPNGGKSQPGCLTSICNHNRSWEFFAATVTHNHLVGRGCSNMSQVNNNQCTGASLRMGNSITNKRGSGIYRVNTGRNYPY